MLDIKSLKFDKSINYLNEQLEIQNNNKQLVLDIMKNLSTLIEKASTKKEKKEYQGIYDSAKKHSENISDNINALESLNSNMDTLTFKLAKLVEEQENGNKPKQYFVDTFYELKNTIVTCTKTLQDLTKKLISDNNDLNEFINDNNFKYNFNSVNDAGESDSNYKFTGFSVKDKEIDVNPVNIEIDKNFDLQKELENNTTTFPVFFKENNEIDSNEENAVLESEEDSSKVTENNAIEEVAQSEETVEEIKEENVTDDEVLEENNSVNTESLEETQSQEQDINKLLEEDLLSDIDIQDLIANLEDITDELENNKEDNQVQDVVQEDNKKDVKEEQNEKIDNIIKNNDLNKNSNETIATTVSDISEKIETILSATVDNETLLISEKTKTIYLPYKLSELTTYMESYPDVYTSLQDVVKQEFILPFNYFMRHPYRARFSETYNILRNREGKGFIPSVTYSLNIARRYNLNPAVIAACKSQNELESYLYYLDSNNLKRFNFFNIIYEINPLSIKK